MAIRRVGLRASSSQRGEKAWICPHTHTALSSSTTSSQAKSAALAYSVEHIGLVVLQDSSTASVGKMPALPPGIMEADSAFSPRNYLVNPRVPRWAPWLAHTHKCGWTGIGWMWRFLFLHGTPEESIPSVSVSDCAAPARKHRPSVSLFFLREPYALLCFCFLSVFSIRIYMIFTSSPDWHPPDWFPSSLPLPLPGPSFCYSPDPQPFLCLPISVKFHFLLLFYSGQISLILLPFQTWEDRIICCMQVPTHTPHNIRPNTDPFPYPPSILLAKKVTFPSGIFYFNCFTPFPHPNPTPSSRGLLHLQQRKLDLHALKIGSIKCRFIVGW